MPKRQSRGVQRQTLKGVKQANNSLGGIMSQMGALVEQVQAGSQAQKEDTSNQSDAKVLMSIKIQQAQLELQKDQAAFLKKISEGQNKQIETLQKSNKDWKGFGDRFKDLKRNLSDALDPNTIKKALLGPFSMFKSARDKRDSYDFVKRSKALGSKEDDKTLMEMGMKQVKARDEALRAQQGIDRLKKMGVSDKQIASSKEMQQRNDALNAHQQIAQDAVSGKSAKDASNTMGGNTSFKSAPLIPAEARPLTDLPTAVTNEAENEKMKVQQTMADSLAAIAANTTMMAGKDQEGNKKQDKKGGGLLGAAGDMLGDIMGFFSNNFFSAIKNLFSVKSLLKVVGKVFAPAMIIGSLFSGIMDGFQAWKETGSLKEALIAGLGGVLDFLTFGLLDANTIRNVADNVKGFVNKYLMQPIYDFIDGTGDMFNQYIATPIKTAFGKMMEWGQNLFDLIYDFLITPISTAIEPLKQFFDDAIGSVLNFLKNITIPGVAFKVPLYGDVAFGPWHPFQGTDKKSADNVAAQAPDPKSGAMVGGASKSNADEQAKVDGKKGTAIVNAPTSNVSNSTQTSVIKPQVRNTESSYNRYMNRRFA